MNYFRDYDPQTGRYSESDPIGLAGMSYSTYAYVRDNPISGIDRFGLVPMMPAPLERGSVLQQITQQWTAGLQAMWDNYERMQWRNWKGDDLYYHCMANCQATSKGPGGAVAASQVSFLRTDIWGRLTEPDWQDDAGANQCGQKGGDCAQRCAPFIPLSSPGKPPFPGW